MDDELIAPGEVWLVGAGPGDPDLLTRKAERLIRAASVIFFDALVGPGVLALVPAHVRCVPVGKRSGRHSKDQRTIDGLLVEAALNGERVVRLKGGDPAVFARSAEEIEALGKHGIRTRICPGITAASAAAASAGVPLTLRGMSRKLVFITAHTRNGLLTDFDPNALADPETTLAIYMGRTAAPALVSALMAHGLPGNTPTLIAVNVSLPNERLVRTRLDLLPLTVRSMAGDQPTMLLIGASIGHTHKSAPADRVFTGIKFHKRASAAGPD